MTDTMSATDRRAAEARRILAERRTGPPPGWSRSPRAGTFPEPPPPAAVDPMLNAEQRAALAAYCERHAALVTAIEAQRAARRAVDAAVVDDSAAAHEAALAGAGVAPPSVRPEREQAAERAGRYVVALAGVLEDDLLALWRLLAVDQERIVLAANAALADDDGRKAERTGRLAQLVDWALGLHERLALPEVPAEFVRDDDPVAAARTAALDQRTAAVQAFARQPEVEP